MFYTLKSNHDKTKFILTKSDHQNQPPTHDTNQPRNKTKLNSSDYQRSLRRAFARAKLLAYFNPDLNTFITLTYKQNLTDHTQTLHHLKQFFKYQQNQINKSHQRACPLEKKQTQKTQSPTYVKAQEFSTLRGHKKPHSGVGNSEKKLPTHAKDEKTSKYSPLKYIYVFEKQKRGAIHVHMITNDVVLTELNDNGYESVKYWKHGYSSVLRIEDTDNNFRPYLYLFKYMTKSARIGKSFIHTSRNFDKILQLDYRDYIDKLNGENLLFTEDNEIYIDGRKSRITKEYYQSASQDDNKITKG